MRPKKMCAFLPKISGFYTKSAETHNLFCRLDTNLYERWRRNWRQNEVRTLICNRGFYHTIVNYASAFTGAIRSSSYSSIKRA